MPVLPSRPAIEAEAGGLGTEIVPGGFFDRVRRSRALVWLVFAGTHLALIVGTLPFTLAGKAGGDVGLYEGWAHHALFTGQWPVFTYDWVYPAGALLFVLLPAVAGFHAYQIVWLLLMAVAGGIGLWFLVERGRRRHDLTAAWFYAATLAVLSPLALLRLEGFTAPAVIVALVFLSTRPRLAGLLLAAATWVKVWPVAVVVAAVVASSKRWIVVVTGAALSAAVVLAVVIGGGASHLDSFVTAQDGRPLQIEAPLSTPWVWMAMFGVDGARVFHDHALVTEEVTGPGDAWLVAHGTLVMLVIMAALVVVLIIATRRLSIFARPLGRELDLVLLGAIGLASAFVVFNKVVSPQYLLWLTPIVAVGLLTKPVEWRLPAVLLLVTSILTIFVYPTFYDDLIALSPVAVVMLAVRNLLLVAVFVWAVWKLVVAAFVRQPVPLGTRPFDFAVRNTSY